MSERETPNQVKNSGEDANDEMRPLPDGGLGAAMPDWLRKPPAWRDLPRSERAPEPAAQEFPEPDTSVIDPRTLVDIDDLPAWLQEIAARSDDAPSASETEPGTVAESDAAPPVEPPKETPSDATTATTVELTTDTATPTPARTTPTWIWIMRGAIIFSLLLVIYYVFFL